MACNFAALALHDSLALLCTLSCRYTKAAIADLKEAEDEMLRGVDWGAVARYVDLQEELDDFRWARFACFAWLACFRIALLCPD